MLFNAFSQFLSTVKTRLFGPKKPIVHLYTICWNEAYMLPYFFKHYDAIVDRYVIFDDGSTDATLEILRQHPKVEVRPLPRLDVDSYVLSAQNIHNSLWKESRGQADWVIWTAIDEHLYHPNLIAYLHDCQAKGVTLVPAIGYQMLSDTLPTARAKLCQQVTRGAPWVYMNKLSLFNPNAITDTNYAVGRHTAEPAGTVVYPETDELLVLHFKYLSPEWTLARNLNLDKKLGKVDKDNLWAYNYAWSMAELRKDWDTFAAGAIDPVLPQTNPANRPMPPNPPLWWR